MNFVETQGERFMLDGAEFPLVGANAYFLLDETIKALGRGDEPLVAREVLRKLAKLGSTVVRALACLDTPDGSICLQRAPGEYDELATKALGTVLDIAAEEGVRLLLVLSNYWDDYGGVKQYLRWHDKFTLFDRSRGAFFEDEGIRAHFRKHIEWMMSQRSPEGVLFASHPGVFGWELINEARGNGTSATNMAAWVEEMAGVYRGTGAKQLLGTGESGYDDIRGRDADVEFLEDVVGRWVVNGKHNTSLAMNTKHVDFGSVHTYPESWDVPKEHSEAIGAAWMRTGAKTARALNKPLIVGEIGLINDDDFPKLAQHSLPERRAIYERWLRLAEEREVAGVLLWLFTNDRRPSDWDRFSFTHLDGTEPSDPRNKYADLLQAHAARMRSR